MDREQVGRHREARRVEVGWTQAELAQAAKVSTRTISNAESGEFVSERSLITIAQALGADVARYMYPDLTAVAR